MVFLLLYLIPLKIDTKFYLVFLPSIMGFPGGAVHHGVYGSIIMWWINVVNGYYCQSNIYSTFLFSLPPKSQKEAFPSFSHSSLSSLAFPRSETFKVELMLVLMWSGGTSFWEGNKSKQSLCSRQDNFGNEITVRLPSVWSGLGQVRRCVTE